MEAQSEAPKIDSGKARRAQVWDAPTRLAHWSLAGGTLAALATGLLAPEWWLPVHVWAGSAAAGALLARLVWGLFGSGPSRFSAFLLRAGAIRRHLASMRRRETQRFFGHPPAGALMAVLLLAGVGVALVTGLAAYGGQEKLGPLAGLITGAAGEGAAEVHELAAWGILALVAGHLAGIGVESRLAGEPLAATMITGRRRKAPAPSRRERAPARPGTALAAGSGLAALLGAGWLGLTQLPPLKAPLPVHDTRYAEACDDCHMAFPPSLLPASSWRQMMAGLDDHFGENAFLPPGTRKSVTAFLTRHGAGNADTEAARHLREVDPDQPLRVTAAPYWQHRHAALPEALFQTRAVGDRSNCPACHEDATSGWFRDGAITLPDPTTKETS